MGGEMRRCARDAGRAGAEVRPRWEGAAPAQARLSYGCPYERGGLRRLRLVSPKGGALSLGRGGLRWLKRIAQWGGERPFSIKGGGYAGSGASLIGEML